MLGKSSTAPAAPGRIAIGLRLLAGALGLCAVVTALAAPIGRTITIDGIFTDWTTPTDITTNLDQSSTDAQGTSGFCTPPLDRDCLVQATGRDLERFAYTYDNANLYLYVERYASTTNATDWWFYIDYTDGAGGGPDGLMQTGETVLHVNWSGSNRRTIRTLYQYVQSASGPDPLVSPITGKADGYDMPGTIANGVQLDPNNNPLFGGGFSGVQMEVLLPWNLVKPGATGPTSVGFHISSSNGTNIPQQIDDNMDGPAADGGGGLIQFADPAVSKSGPPEWASTFPLEFVVTLTNNGPDPALNLVLQDDCTAMATDRALAAGESIVYDSHSVTAGTYTPGTVAPYGDGIWELASLAAGASETLTLTCIVTVDDPIDVTNTVTIVDQDTSDTDTGNNVASTTVPVIVLPLPDLTVLKSSTVLWDPVNGSSLPKRIPGACVIYTVQVVNNGQGEAEEVEIADSLPGNLSFFTGAFASAPTECGGTTVAGDPLDFDEGGNAIGAEPLAYSFVSLGDGGDSLEFYDSSDALITPSVGFDGDVAKIIVRPTGTVKGQSQNPNPPTSQYQFFFRYIVRID